MANSFRRGPSAGPVRHANAVAWQARIAAEFRDFSRRVRRAGGPSSQIGSESAGELAASPETTSRGSSRRELGARRPGSEPPSSARRGPARARALRGSVPAVRDPPTALRLIRRRGRYARPTESVAGRSSRTQRRRRSRRSSLASTPSCPGVTRSRGRRPDATRGACRARTDEARRGEVHARRLARVEPKARSQFATRVR